MRRVLIGITSGWVVLFTQCFNDWCFTHHALLQECAPGYYRQAVSELDMKGRKRPLVRPCVPCQCSNHSLSCDLDTGECLVRNTSRYLIINTEAAAWDADVIVFRDASTTPQESTATSAPQGIMGRFRAPSATARCAPVRCGVRGEVTWSPVAVLEIDQ